MRAKRNRENLVLLLILGSLLVPVGCNESSMSTPIVQTTEDQVTVSAPADLLKISPPEKDGIACCEVPLAAAAQAEGAEVPVQTVAGSIVLPDVTLLNEDGEPVQFRQLTQGKIIAMNFVFTTCKGICPPMGANFAALQRQLGNRYAGEVALVSVSVDPTIDTPQRLKAWRDKFEGGPGWTLLTGAKRDVDHLLKELEVFTADKNDHSPFVLVGDVAAGKWSRVHGLTAPHKLAEIIGDLHTASLAAARQSADSTVAIDDDAVDIELPKAVKAQSAQTTSEQVDAGIEPLPPAQKYFTDVELMNQHGETMRLYSDVLKGKVVVINSFFSTCKGSCPVMMASFARIQQQFADRLGKDLVLVSITVDPKTDTPEVLATYAEQWKAKPGWYFLTGDKASVETALYKVGHYVENKESHSNVFVIGNEATGLWKKARGLSQTDALFPLVEEVLNDKI